MKKCPYCFEEIKDEAIVCRYCRRELPGYEEEMNRRKIEAERSVQIEGINRQAEIIRQEPPPPKDKPEIVPTPTPNDEEINRPSQPVMQESSPQQVKHDDILPQTPIIEAMNKPTQTVPQELQPQQEKLEDTPTQIPNGEEMNSLTGIVMQEIQTQQEQHENVPLQTPKPNYRKNAIVGISIGMIMLCVFLAFMSYVSTKFNNSPNNLVLTNVSNTLNTDSKPNSTKTEEFTAPLIPTDTPLPTNTPSPTDTPIPTPTFTPLPQPIIIQGNKPDVVDLEKWEGPAIVHMLYQGVSNFIVSSLDKDGQPTSMMGLANEIGNFEGWRLIDNLGAQTTRLEISMAEGPYTIEIFPVAREYLRALTVPGTFSGSIPDLIFLDGAEPDLITLKYNGDANFIVDALDASLQPSAMMGLVNEIGTFEGKKVLPAGTKYIYISFAGGPYILEVTSK